MGLSLIHTCRKNQGWLLVADVIERVLHLCKSNLIFLPFFSLGSFTYARRRKSLILITSVNQDLGLGLGMHRSRPRKGIQPRTLNFHFLNVTPTIKLAQKCVETIEKKVFQMKYSGKIFLSLLTSRIWNLIIYISCKIVEETKQPPNSMNRT